MRSLERLTRSASFRLAAALTALFLSVVLAVGATSLAVIRHAELSAAHAELEAYEDDITEVLTRQGPGALVGGWPHLHAVDRDFRVEDFRGRVLAGALPPPPALPPAGELLTRKIWTLYRVGPLAPHPGGAVVALTHPERDGQRLSVGEYLDVREQRDDRVLFAVILMGGLAAGLGLVGGLMVSRDGQRRIDQLADVVGRYADGDRDARIPTRPRAAADHDDLAHAINSMMDRENRLIEGLRQTTMAIAHDLRRPLSHHNQEIARALSGPPDARAYRRALVAASERADDVLQTFQSLLHIAELEAGAPALPLSTVDVGEVAERVVEAYGPLAEEGGRPLSVHRLGGDLKILGDARVLGRAMANLIENALAHTPPGTRIKVNVDGAERRLVVEDNGPGVPDGACGKIFERFFRLDASRSTAGSGLGLPLAAAAVRAFGGRLTAENASPGLRLVAVFARTVD